MLCRALEACCSNPDLLHRFLLDVMSHDERRDCANRFAAAWSLMQGKTQTATARELGISLKVVQRVDEWVHGPFANRGFWDVAERLNAAESVGGPAGEPESAPAASTSLQK